MILNTGVRTDTIQYFTPWLLKRFEEGYVLSRNPMFQQKVTRYELTPEKVDCVVFCSKNYKPILKDIVKITDKFNTYFYYTITAYEKDVEPGVPSIEESIKALKELSKIVGKQRLAWRYDPVLLTEKYTIAKHLKIFDAMAKAIEVIDGRAKVEASGNVDAQNIRALADLGVDFISSGALTHSAPILDLSLKHLRMLDGA